MKPLAYSYLRFSTPRQAKGDSFRRQMEAAVRYACEHDLDLQDDSFNDFGVSAFKGRNAQEGALGEFIQLVQDGRITKGSYLLVENHDRLSRMATEDALHQFQTLIRSGVNIVTLHDGEVYKNGEMDMIKLITSIVYMERANNESDIKSKRGKAVWESRRRLMAEGQYVKASQLPQWLTYTEGEVRIIPERVELIRQIFNWYVDRFGYQAIARRLNNDGVPTFRNKSGWAQSTIWNILKNRAVIGEFQPHELNADGKRVPIGDVIKLYPAIIPIETYKAVQAKMKQNKESRPDTSKGKACNLFSSLIKCGNCGSPMTAGVKGKSKSKYYIDNVAYICSKGGRGCTCLNLNWAASVVEDHISQALPLLFEYYTRGDDNAKAKRIKDSKEAEICHDIELLEEQLDKITEAILLAPTVRKFTDRANEIQKQIDSHRSKLEKTALETVHLNDTVATKEVRATKIMKMMANMKIGSTSEIAIKREDLNIELCRVFSEIWMQWCYLTHRAVITFIDKAGIEIFELQFEEGLEKGVGLALVDKIYNDKDLVEHEDDPLPIAEHEPICEEVVTTFVERTRQSKSLSKVHLNKKYEVFHEMYSKGQCDGLFVGEVKNEN